jgi:hypothetical protein
VFYEVIRLWPGLPKNLRRAISNDVLPSLPDVNLPEVKINQGDYILWSDYYMMRHPQVRTSWLFGKQVEPKLNQIWGADAAVFNPARHIDANGQFIKPKAPNFHAFGAGPRLWYEEVNIFHFLPHSVVPTVPQLNWSHMSSLHVGRCF